MSPLPSPARRTRSRGPGPALGSRCPPIPIEVREGSRRSREAAGWPGVGGEARRSGARPPPPNQRESRRGENKKQATGTATSEPTGKTPSGAGGGREVTGTLISARPGAPGLHSAGAGTDGGRWLAVGIGAASLLLVLAGARLERRERGRS